MGARPAVPGLLRVGLAEHRGLLTQVVAVDWSGRAVGAERAIWTAVVRDGALVELEGGRSRAEVAEDLLERVRARPRTVVGLDFAFSFPAWYLDGRGWRDGPEAWSAMAAEGESLLAECGPPFWGRPGTRAQTVGEPLRETERRLVPRPKSVFQIGGAGAVGTGSVRGMPHLAELADAGGAVWPFAREVEIPAGARASASPALARAPRRLDLDRR